MRAGYPWCSWRRRPIPDINSGIVAARRFILEWASERGEFPARDLLAALLAEKLYPTIAGVTEGLKRIQQSDDPPLERVRHGVYRLRRG